MDNVLHNRLSTLRGTTKGAKCQKEIKKVCYTAQNHLTPHSYILRVMAHSSNVQLELHDCLQTRYLSHIRGWVCWLCPAARGKHSIHTTVTDNNLLFSAAGHLFITLIVIFVVSSS